MGDYILLFVVISSVAWLALTVYKADSKSSANRAFFFLLAFVCLWVLCNFFEAEVKTPRDLAFLIHLDFSSAAWIAFFFLRFCLFFPVKSAIRVPTPVLVSLAVIVSAASFSDLVVRNINIVSEDSQPSFDLGPMFWLYAPVVGGYIFSGIYFMFRKMRNLTGLPQAQAGYVLLGMGISGAVAVIVNLGIASFMPISVTASRFGIYSILALAWFPAYAILRYRLMDIRVLIQESVSYLVTSAAVGFGAVFIVHEITPNLYVAVFTFLLSVLAPYLQQRFQKWINDLKLRRGIVGSKNARAINTLADRIKESGHRISDLAETVVQMVADEFPITTCSIFVMDYDTRDFTLEGRIGATGGVTLIVHDDPLMKYLSDHHEIIVRSEVNRRMEEKQADVLMATPNKVNAEVCVPLFVFDQLAGVLFLGGKKDHKAFFTNDLLLLKMIVDETSTALRYVLAVSLKAKETIKWAHSLHQSLKPLQIGFEFLSRKATQNGGDAGVESVIPRVQNSIKKLGEFLRFLLQDSRISEEALRNKYKLVPIDIKSIIEEGISMHRITAESKGIQMVEEINKPNGAVFGHDRDLISVFEILTSNALRYTPTKGLIKVTGRMNGSMFFVDFFNNGPQIPNENLEAIFSDRFQIKDGNQGMEGFGLANAARIMKMHNGKIWAENETDGSGVKFTLEFPIKNP